MDYKLLLLISISIKLILTSGFIAYSISNKEYNEKNKKNMPFTLFLNNGIEKLSLKQILVGMVFGIVFGFVDNAGLWFGMEALDPYLPGGKLTKAGFGNTYSNTLGSSLGTFISVIMAKITMIEKTPIWTDIIGTIIGCILGIYIPRFLTGLD